MQKQKTKIMTVLGLIMALSFFSVASATEQLAQPQQVEKSFNMNSEEWSWAIFIGTMILGPISTAGGAYSTYYGVGTGAAVTVGLSAGMTIFGLLEDWFYDRERQFLKEEALDFMIEQKNPSHSLQTVFDEVRMDKETEELSDLQIATLTYVMLIASESNE